MSGNFSPIVVFGFYRLQALNSTISSLLQNWDALMSHRKAFVKSQGSDVYKMLSDWKLGKNHSWAIRFCCAQYVLNKLSVVPNRSLVNNEGFDGDGTNCKRYSRFKIELNESKEQLIFKFPTTVRLNVPCINKHCGIILFP